MSILIQLLAAGVVDAEGQPLSGGHVYIYSSGTTEKADVYKDPDLEELEQNPLTLDDAGKAQIYVNEAVRVLIKDSEYETVSDIQEVGGILPGEEPEPSDIVATQLVPIGSIIPFYDFNGALSFDTDYWAYCDGSTATIADSARTLPDLSGRYLVGFGSDGGGDNDDATWATTAVGNAGHIIDLSHTHDVDVTSFTSGAGSSHTHSVANLFAKIGPETGGTTRITVGYSGDTFTGTDRWATGGIGMDTTNAASSDAIEIGGTLASESAHTHSINPPNTTSDSQLSATQSIQPRSVRVRFLMRIK